MLNNGNWEKFQKDFKLQESFSLRFTERLRNRNAQQSLEYARGIKCNYSFYELYEEFVFLSKFKDKTYGSHYECVDHTIWTYSKDFDCFIMTAQPYWFEDNIEKIKKTWVFFGLSFVILKDYTWHNKKDCTLYCIGIKENLIKIFGKIDFTGETNE